MSPSGSVHRIARSVAEGRESAADIVGRALSRSHRSQPVLNAFTSIDDEGALQAARRVDEAVAAGNEVGTLAGVPIAIKDLIDHEGRPNSYGSSRRPVIPTETAPAIAKLEEAGAVVIGRTVLHEFAFGFSSENHWFGPVRNPWDLDLSPGGSSGGSAAAVAAGLVPVALGTDTGGSVRVPAAMCGIVGLKTTHGRVSVRGVLPLAPTIDTVGPLGRSVADVAAVYEAMAGDDPDDPWSVPEPVRAAGGPADLSQLTIGVPHPLTDLPMVAEQQEAFDRCLQDLGDQGAARVDLDIPSLMPSRKTADGLYFEVANVHSERWAESPDQYGPEVRQRVEETMQATAAGFFEAMAWRRSVRAQAMRALEQVDVLVTPTVASLRKRIGVDTVVVGSEEMHYRRALARFATVVNHIGLPALAVPLPGAARPPPSVQLIGPEWSEHRLIEIGLALEERGIASTARPPNWRPESVDANPERSA